MNWATPATSVCWGVTFTDDGSVYSIQDMFSERTLVFLAEARTELMPLTLSSLYQPHCKWLRTASHTRVLLATRNPISLAPLSPPSALGRQISDRLLVGLVLSGGEAMLESRAGADGSGLSSGSDRFQEGAGIDSFLVPGRGIKKGEEGRSPIL